MVKKISLTFFAQVHVLFADLFGSDNIINYWKMRICLDIFFMVLLYTSWSARRDPWNYKINWILKEKNLIFEEIFGDFYSLCYPEAGYLRDSSTNFSQFYPAVLPAIANIKYIQELRALNKSSWIYFYLGSFLSSLAFSTLFPISIRQRREPCTRYRLSN